MAPWDRDEHQPEPWTQEGRVILSAGGWRLGKAVLVPDARRIVAAVNDTLGIPTTALEAGFIRDLLELKIWPRADRLKGRANPLTPPPDAVHYFLSDLPEAHEYFPYERRRGDRRRSERRRNSTGR
jgi:hypothetical protein